MICLQTSWYSTPSSCCQGGDSGQNRLHHSNTLIHAHKMPVSWPKPCNVAHTKSHVKFSDSFSNYRRAAVRPSCLAQPSSLCYFRLCSEGSSGPLWASVHKTPGAFVFSSSFSSGCTYYSAGLAAQLMIWSLSSFRAHCQLGSLLTYTQCSTVPC